MPKTFVKDPLTDEWIPQKQPPAAEVPQGLPKDRRYEYDGKNMIYRGLHFELNADEADAQWSITKYTWDGTPPNLIRQQGPILGAWSNRENLGW